MRFDMSGLWWQDSEQENKLRNKTRYAPSVPETGWTYPRDFPNLSGVKVLGIDTETKDLNLLTNGPGWARNDGHIVGVSIATEHGGKWYWPLRHEYQTEDNVPDPAPVFAFLKDHLENPRIAKVGANLLYDMGWLHTEGINVQGKLFDVLYAGALINKLELKGRNNLDSLGLHYTHEGKGVGELYKWSAAAYGGKPTSPQRANIYRCPPKLVGPYAEGDADLPISIMLKQWQELQELGLSTVFDLECRLIPLLLRMRLRGVCIDEEATNQAIEKINALKYEAQRKLNLAAGFEVGIYTPTDIQRYCDKHGIEYPLTDKGAPSFRKPWLANHSHPAMHLIKDARKYDKAGTFLKNSILDKHVDGKLYPNFHPLREETIRGDSKGTGYGRFSSSDPNAQQVPSRDKELAPIIRGCFVPHPGYSNWLKMDLSQIEYRFFAHYAVDGWKLRQAYTDPHTDFHAVVSASLENRLPRGPVKNINFGKLYGMEVVTFSKQLREQLSLGQIAELLQNAGMDPEEKDPYLQYAVYASALYDERFPEAKRTLNAYAEHAATFGEVRTILGRIARFDYWAPAGYGNRDKAFHGTMHAAIRHFGIAAIERQHTHKALNHVLQGSAAELLKKGMVDAYEAGTFDRLGYPSLTVHDELDFPYNEDLRGPARELKWYVENAIPLKVPVIMDAEVGTNWGNVKEYSL